MRYARMFVDGQASENSVRWGVCIDSEDGMRLVLSDGERGGKWVRIRQYTYDTRESSRGRKWGEYDLPDDPPWLAKVALSILGFVVLQWVSNAALVGTDLSLLIIPTHIVFLAWLVSLWTGGGRWKRNL